MTDASLLPRSCSVLAVLLNIDLNRCSLGTYIDGLLMSMAFYLYLSCRSRIVTVVLRIHCATFADDRSR